MPSRDVIVVGGSAGSVTALSVLLADLPASFPGAIFVVVHISAEGPALLPSVLARRSRLPVAYATDGAPVTGGRVLVARPDHHVLLRDGQLSVTQRPSENRFDCGGTPWEQDDEGVIRFRSRATDIENEGRSREERIPARTPGSRCPSRARRASRKP